MARPRDNGPYRIGVLMVNFRQWELTEKCVRSVLGSEGVRVVIGLVDNNSPGPVPSWVEDTPEVVFHRNPGNLGFTAGNNRAFEMLAERDLEYVIILNNDTEVAPDTLFLLADFLEKNPGTGITVPAITYASRPDMLWNAGGVFIKWRMNLKPLYRYVSELPTRPFEVDQATGCAMMMRWNSYRDAGMQDTDLFIYYDDVDLTFKMRNLGFTTHLVPGSIVRHHVSISVGGVFSPFAIYFTHRNRYIVALRHLKPPVFIAFLFYYFGITLIKTILYPLKRNGHLVYWMWLGVLHGVRRKPEFRPEGLFPDKVLS
jgi:hypothetical protein